MSSPYLSLNNRPIDQWKVTELKEELRRRKLKINGLKEELVRRLDEALRSEMEEAEDGEAEKEDLGNESHHDNDPDDEADEDESASPANYAEPVEEEKPVPQPAESNAESVEEMSAIADKDAALAENIDNTIDLKDSSDSSGDDDNSMEDQGAKKVGTVNLDATVEDNTESAVSLRNNASDGQIGVGQSGDQKMRNDESNVKPPAEDIARAASEPANQVSEVSTDLGFQVKSDSISTDSLSIIEKIELKDNLNANNVNLELEVIKPKMVQSSSSDIATIGGDHPLEDNKGLVGKHASLEEAGADADAHPTDMELCKKIEGVDGGSPEKLNLDRSSGDESMEEDVSESKQIESKNSSEVGERGEDIKKNCVQETKPIEALVGEFSPEKNDIIFEEEIKSAAAAEKRKAEDQEIVNKNEQKRQRRWNSDPAKAAEPPASSMSPSVRKDASQPALRRSFSRSESNVSGDAPKERIVPPSQKAATTSLRIDRFLRPFTLKAVQELLAKTGTVSDFWMDHIKTHCYVTYLSVEEAIATRNALYNLQWPTNGGRLLVAEFVDPQEVKTRVEGPPQSPATVTPSPTTPTAPPFQRLPQQPARTSPLLRQQQLPPPPPLLPPPPATALPKANPPPARERLPLPPPPAPKKPEPPVMTLDDLFKKTKATPRIYYLPLTEEQVAAKLAAKQRRDK